MKILPKLIGLILTCHLVMFMTLVATRSCVEARKIPGTSMMPTLQPGDRLILEKVSKLSGQMVEKGAIIVYYPPAVALPGREDLSYDVPHVLGRLTGLPCFPNSIAYVSRVIGTAGDTINIKENVGVFVNGKLIEEPYTNALPAKNVSTLGQLGGFNPMNGMNNLFPDTAGEKIIVPKNAVFVLSDNRTEGTIDSRSFGFVTTDRIDGRAWVMVFPLWEYIRAPNWKRPPNPAWLPPVQN